MMEKFMGRMSILAILLLITSIVCDDNNVTTPLSTTPLTSSTPSSISVTSSTSTTTVAPQLSENTTKPAQVPPTSTLSSNRKQLASPSCNCDLTLDCEFNCCCDLDCSDEIVEAFNCNSAVDIDIEDFYYGEGLERCGIDGGLFCIANMPSTNTDESIKVPFYAEYLSYQWPKVDHEPTEVRQQVPSHDVYKFGDAILTYDRKAESFQTIKVPVAFNIGDNSRCTLTEPVKFLNTKSIKCLRSINELCSYNNQLMMQLFNSQLFHRPPKMMAISNETFGVVVESCKHSSDNCTQASYVNDGDAEVIELLGDEVYENIQIEFVINGTEIISALAKFTCRNNLVCGNGEDLDPTKLIQNIEVRFRNFNETKKGVERTRDYSRGYNNGDAIFVSRLRPLNESAPSSDLAFDFFRNDTKTGDFHYKLKLPENGKNGRCLMEIQDDAHDVVRFNENSFTKCTVELTRDEISNFTLCQQFQQQLIHFLFSTMNLTSNYTLDGYLSDVYISKFWAPNRDVSSWARVSFSQMPQWSPKIHESEKITTCLNMVTSAHYKIFYSSHKTSGAKRYHHTIENLHVEFGQVHEIKFTESEEENQTVEVEIQINVYFVNANLKNVKNLAPLNNFANYLVYVGMIFMAMFK